MYYSGPINNGYQARGEKVSRGPMAPAGSSGNMDIPQTSTKYMGDSQGGPISGASGNPGMMPKKSTNASDFPYQQPKPDGAKKMGGPGIGGFPPQGGQQSRGNPGQSSNYYQSGPSGQSGSSGNYAPTSNQYSRDMMGKGPKHIQKDSYNSYSRGNNYGSGYLEQQNYYEETGKSGSKGGSDKGGRLDGITDVPVSLAVDGMDGGDQSRGGYQRNKKYDQDSKQMSGPLNNSSVGAPSSSYYNSSRRDNQRFDANAGPNKREKFPNKKKGNKHRPEQFQDEYVESIAEDQDSQALSQGLGDSKLMGSSTVISTHGATSVNNHQDKSRQTHPREKQPGPRDYPKKEDKITEQDARREELIRKFAHVPQFNHEVGPMVRLSLTADQHLESCMVPETRQ